MKKFSGPPLVPGRRSNTTHGREENHRHLREFLPEGMV